MSKEVNVLMNVWVHSGIYSKSSGQWNFLVTDFFLNPRLSGTNYILLPTLSIDGKRHLILQRSSSLTKWGIAHFQNQSGSPERKRIEGTTLQRKIAQGQGISLWTVITAHVHANKIFH